MHKFWIIWSSLHKTSFKKLNLYSMANFLERFKGKTSLMGKEGIPISEHDKPIIKPSFISIINEKDQIATGKSPSFSQLDSKKFPQRNFHSVSSQSNKPSHFIQAAKNSIGMATYDFSPERNYS